MPEMTFQTYYLDFRTAVHLGDSRPEDYGSSLRYLHSDTLHAALFSARALVGKDVPKNGKPGYLLSSLFPFCQIGDSILHFFPKLMLPFQIRGEITYAKKLKQLQWLDQSYFEAQASGKSPEGFGGEGQPHLQGVFCSKRFPLPSIYQIQTAQRVSIPRFREGGQDPTPFYMERVFFSRGAGLFFLFKGNEEERKDLEEGLDILRYEGLGTDRTVGYGAFDWKSGEITLQVPPDEGYRTNLSLLCPDNREALSQWLDENAAYTLTKRGGWITTPGMQTYRKQSVYMFLEGGIFKATATELGRENIDLTPGETPTPISHPIWRNGKALMIPVKIT